MTRRKYKKDIDALKPDLKSYNAQKEAAMAGSSSSEARLLTGDPSAEVEDQALVKAPNSELLYRDANSFVYADHKPSEEAVDRVISKINMDQHKRNKFSRKRNEEGQDVTYINDANKVRHAEQERLLRQIMMGAPVLTFITFTFTELQQETRQVC